MKIISKIRISKYDMVDSQVDCFALFVPENFIEKCAVCIVFT